MTKIISAMCFLACVQGQKWVPRFEKRNKIKTK